jgi:hypothetical protein
MTIGVRANPDEIERLLLHTGTQEITHGLRSRAFGGLPKRATCNPTWCRSSGFPAYLPASAAELQKVATSEETDAAVGVRPRARFADHKEFATDSSLEEAGFEPWFPLHNVFPRSAATRASLRFSFASSDAMTTNTPNSSCRKPTSFFFGAAKRQANSSGVRPHAVSLHPRPKESDQMSQGGRLASASQPREPHQPQILKNHSFQPTRSACPSRTRAHPPAA